MTDMTIELLLPRLIKEFHYPTQGARLVAGRIIALTPEIKQLFNLWWQDGLVPDIEIEGYTADELMNTHRMNPIAAFLTLDWLAREPAAAIASLKKGHDRIE